MASSVEPSASAEYKSRHLRERRELSECSFVVTGAAQGIGRACVELLLTLGSRVVAADVDLQALGELESSLHLQSRAGGRLTTVACDVTVEEDVRRMLQVHIASNGRLDGVVNSAGISHTGVRLEDLSDQIWQRILDVNLGGTFRVCRASLPLLREAGGGSIVNIGSVHANFGAESAPAYAASKGAIVALSRQMAIDYARDGIRVNSLAVGSVDTRLTRQVVEAAGGPGQLGLTYDRNATARIAAPSEVASVVVFLLSSASSFVSASDMAVDGGLTARLF